jgi:methyl-accepting chemotaxis protein
MKIKTKLRLNSLIYMVVIMIMLLFLALSFWGYERADRNVNLVLKIRNIAFERIALRDDYLLYREERASIQWQAKSETIRALMETAAGQFTTGEEKALLQEARKDFDATYFMFSAILEKHKRENRRSDVRFTFDEAESRLIGQVFLKSYALIDSLGRLHQSTEMAAKRAKNIGAFVIIFIFVGGGMVIVFNSAFLNRTLAKRVRVLNDGVGIIGGGNLDYHIAEEGDDELADLASASNKMVVKLKNYAEPTVCWRSSARSIKLLCAPTNRTNYLPRLAVSLLNTGNSGWPGSALLMSKSIQLNP